MTPFEDNEPEKTIFISRKRAPEAVPVADTIGHYLVVTQGSTQGKRVELTATPITIGRDARQTLAFDDTEVSRLHARVSLINGEAVVEDPGSTNGTFLGAERLTAPVTLKDGDVFRIGRQLVKYERRSRKDVKHAQELDRDLRKATDYVFSLLPTPLTSGPVHAEWRFVPSAQLGGDAFGYYWLDPNTFVFYLIDVSGHGVGSAMHSVTVLNVLRQRALPNVDFQNPAQVLSSLNVTFQMESHNGMYFTMWYGVYRANDRTLVYGSAGHHPAFLVPADKGGEPQGLGMPALMIGAMPEPGYTVQEATIPPGSSLYLFSDGAFEIVTTDQQRWGLSDFLPLLVQPAVPGTPETERIYRAVKQAAGPGTLEDDFSLVAVTFP